MTVTTTVCVLDPRTPELVDYLGDYGDDRGFFRWTSGFLVERTWVMLTTDVCDGPLGSWLCGSGGGGDHGLLVGRTVGTGIVLDWCRR